MNENAEKLYDLIKKQEGIEKEGHTTFAPSLYSKQTGLKADEINSAKTELLKEGKLFYNNIEINIGSVDLESGEIKKAIIQRLYIDKEAFVKDTKHIKEQDVVRMSEAFKKHAERINNIKNISNEAIGLYSLIEISKKNLAFSDLSLKDMSKITGLSMDEIKNAKQELVDKKIVFEVAIPLKEPYKYKTIDKDGNDIEKEVAKKNVYVTNTEILAKVIKAVELENNKGFNKENTKSWDKTKGNVSIAD